MRCTSAMDRSASALWPLRMPWISSVIFCSRSYKRMASRSSLSSPMCLTCGGKFCVTHVTAAGESSLSKLCKPSITALVFGSSWYSDGRPYSTQSCFCYATLPTSLAGLQDQRSGRQGCYLPCTQDVASSALRIACMLQAAQG